MASGEGQRITYFSKNAIECPVCQTKFNREDLLSGGGRLVAGDLTDELRRSYEPTVRFGEVYPLVYIVTVCPSCFYAAYPQDFLGLSDEAHGGVEAEKEQRIESTRIICDGIDFTESRGLQEGLTSYLLAVMCYTFLDAEVSPTFKKAVSCLRAAWLANDLHGHFPSENYERVALLFYRKARFFYRLTLTREQSGEETLDAAGNHGPDVDKNYGYDGILYLTGLLEFKYGPRKPAERRLANLEEVKRYISKVFGMGKASRAKPSSILDQSRDLFEQMAAEIGRLQEQSSA